MNKNINIDKVIMKIFCKKKKIESNCQSFDVVFEDVIQNESYSRCLFIN